VHSHVWPLILTVLRDLLLLLCASATAFHVFSLVAGSRLLSTWKEVVVPGEQPSVSILKPLRGVDRDLCRNLATYCEQDYRSFEVLVGAEDASDPGLEVARQVARDHPRTDIRIITGSSTAGSNPKLRTIGNLARHARHELLLVSDSDMEVAPDHLRRLVEQLNVPTIGAVTCLYRTSGKGLAGRLEALGFSTEVLPRALVAKMLEGESFGTGAGILTGRKALEDMGGFEAIENRLADDYLLGKLLAEAGHRVAIAPGVVDQKLEMRSFADLAARQRRWNICLRTLRPRGYAALALTQSTLSALLLVVATRGSPLGWSVAAGVLAVRLAVAAFFASRLLGDRTIAHSLWLVPARDLLSSALWASGFFGNTVIWRGRHLKVGAGSRIVA
jgi:ceramide glucosyltransferase